MIVDISKTGYVLLKDDNNFVAPCRWDDETHNLIPDETCDICEAVQCQTKNQAVESKEYLEKTFKQKSHILKFNMTVILEESE